jgi:hypothetical protein
VEEEEAERWCTYFHEATHSVIGSLFGWETERLKVNADGSGSIIPALAPSLAVFSGGQTF